jgi:DNA polymerase III subunit epsilon
VKRPVIVVDCETTGLDPRAHMVVEVAWWNLDTDERGRFVPPHSWQDAVATASLKALQINRYIDRIAATPQDWDHSEAWRLWRQFGGDPLVLDPDHVPATLAGANPAFDAQFLREVFKPLGKEVDDLDLTPWHQRLWDVSAYAAGVLGLDELPGLAKVCELLDVPAPDHSAAGDVTVTGLCLRALMAMVGGRRQ